MKLSSLLPIISLASASPISGAHPQQEVDSMWGDLTYYYAVGTGSCGWSVTGLQHVVALSIAQQGVPASLCGRGVTIEAGGYQVNATVMDSCAGCKWGDIDVDESTFVEIFGGTERGRVKDTRWWFNGVDW